MRLGSLVLAGAMDGSETASFVKIGTGIVVYAVPAGRHFFELESPTAGMTLSWAAGGAIAIVLLIAALRVLAALDAEPERHDQRRGVHGSG